MATFTRVTCLYCGVYEDEKNFYNWKIDARRCYKCDNRTFKTKKIPEGTTNPFGYPEDSKTQTDLGLNYD